VILGSIFLTTFFWGAKSSKPSTLAADDLVNPPPLPKSVKNNFGGVVFTIVLGVVSCHLYPAVATRTQKVFFLLHSVLSASHKKNLKNKQYKGVTFGGIVEVYDSCNLAKTTSDGTSVGIFWSFDQLTSPTNPIVDILFRFPNNAGF